LQLKKALHIGLRLKGIDAVTIQRLPVGCKVTVKGNWRNTVNGSTGKKVKAFYVKALKRAKP